MTQFAAPSILRGIERDDIASIRRVMNALMRRLAGVPSTTAAQMSDLEYNEANVVNRIHLATRGNGLLTAMVTRFASARYGNTNTVIRATANLNGLAVEAVQDPSSRPTMEFTMAEAFFNHQVQTDAFVYGAGGDLEYGDIEPDDDTEMKDVSPMVKELNWLHDSDLISLPVLPFLEWFAAEKGRWWASGRLL